MLCPQVKVTMGKFEERLWSIIRNFVAVSQEEPGLLVTALQVHTAGSLLARCLSIDWLLAPPCFPLASQSC